MLGVSENVDLDGTSVGRGCKEKGGEGVVFAVQLKHRMEKAKNKIAPLNMNKILTFYGTKLTHPLEKSNR
jgi:hypothetical protein